MLPVTALSAIILSAAFQAVSIRVIALRRSTGIAVGARDSLPLTAAMRAQSNLVEYSLFFLILLALCELNEAPTLWLAALAIAFMAGRGLHAYGMLVTEAQKEKGTARFKWRRYGMGATFFVLQSLAGTLLVMLALAI